MKNLNKIREGNGIVLRLLPKGEPDPDRRYRLCRYLCRAEVSGTFRIYHTLTEEMWEVPGETDALLDSLPQPYAPWMDDFIRARILVGEEYDEAADIRMLRWLGENCTDRAGQAAFTILPTTECNARCFYCYEKRFDKIVMTQETARRTVEYMVAKAAGRPLTIGWFGGEPLMGRNIIDQISEDLTNRGIPFSATMISNGSLFTEELAQKAVKDWHLKRIQITLDGTCSSYARIKNYVPGSLPPGAEPYDIVTGNIAYLLDAGVRVNVRLNVSPFNGEDLLTLTGELLQRFRERPEFTVYCCGLFSDESEPYRLNDGEKDTIRSSCRKIDEAIRAARPEDVGSPHSCAFKWTNCMADSASSEVIAPDGTIHKCEHFTQDHACGDVWHGITSPEEEKFFRSLICPPECEACPALPICTRAEKCPVVNKTPDPYECGKKRRLLHDFTLHYRPEKGEPNL